MTTTCLRRVSLNKTLIMSCVLTIMVSACSESIHLTHIANGWAQNSVNTVIFRKNALYTHQGVQYTAFYDGERNLILGKRPINSDQWELKRTPYKGNSWDAHNSISLIVDGNGYLHISWDHHNSNLRYAKSIRPESLELTEELSMTPNPEHVVTYPEFYAMANGDLLFCYRSGASGKGNLVMNKYDLTTGSWSTLSSNLISGENERNAYWQLATDGHSIHISWVWRESADVASNHDMCYARSTDGGISWTRSDGTAYTLPITASTAEVIQAIPQNSELINQTSMTIDPSGSPVIASYWRPAGTEVPQYHVIHHTDGGWKTHNLGFRKEAFSLSGAGTKAIPIARPQVVVSKSNQAYVIFRDAWRGNKVSVASSKLPNCDEWKIVDISDEGYDAWEPTLDPVQWRDNESLHLFLQQVTQVDGEGVAKVAPQSIKVLEWKP